MMTNEEERQQKIQNVLLDMIDSATNAKYGNVMKLAKEMRKINLEYRLNEKDLDKATVKKYKYELKTLS